MNVTTFSVDLAKDTFQVHGYDQGHVRVIQRRLKRKAFASFFTQQKPTRIVMEACRSAHHWARKFTSLGHQVELLAPHHVTAYVLGNKTDATDADAIFEAACRPRFKRVAIKTPEQQALQAQHRVREGWCQDRTRTVNRLRGLLAEFGIEIPVGGVALRRALPDILSDADNELPASMRPVIASLRECVLQLDARIQQMDRDIAALCRSDEAARRLCTIDGIGPLTATAIVAAIGDAASFDNSRQLAASLGLVPREHSSGDRRKLGAITKRGNTYVRTLLVHGGRAAVRASKRRDDPRSCWINTLAERIGPHKAAVAVANKNARVVWALLHRGGTFNVHHD